MSSIIRFLFFAADVILLNLCLWLSYVLLGSDPWGADRANSVYLFILSNLSWMFLVVVANPYQFSRRWSFSKILKSQFSFLLIHLLVVTALIVLFRKSYRPEQLGLTYLLFTLSFFLWKLAAWFGASAWSDPRLTSRRYVLVGDPDLAREVRRYFLVHEELGYRFCGLFPLEEERMPLDKVRAFCEEHMVSELFCCLPGVTHRELRRVVDVGMNELLKVRLVSDRNSFEQRSLVLERYDQVPVFDISTIPLDNVWNQRLKRSFDLAFSIGVIVFVLTWLVPIVGLAIKLDSSGPIFFRQRRSGRNNRPFDCIKFRTMVVNQEAEDRQATLNDPRVTRLGAFLRKSSLDEFPQFLNVLSGEMSIVGPRPHPIRLNEKFRPLINKYMIRHYVKPGVTGLAQVMGYRGETRLVRDMRNRITLDRFYIENWTFYFDIKIILMTVWSVVRSDEKAY